MSDRRHTPGPWTADRDVGDDYNIIADAPGEGPGGKWSYIAEVQANSEGSRSVDADEAEANAQLIAAAPELLAACQAAYVRLQCIHAEGTDEIHADAAYKALGEVIARATGNPV